jgi:uncharacterized protein (DUF885 family)
MLRFAMVLLLFVAAVPAQSRPEELQRFFSQVFEERLRDQPEFATYIGRQDYDDRWNDWSRSGRERRRAHIQQRLGELDRFQVEGLSEADLLSVHVLRYALRQDLAAYDLETYLLPVAQMYGLHNRIYLTIDRMPSHTVHDYENILARLHAIPTYVDQSIAMLDEASQRGLLQPRVVVDLVTKQITAQVAQDQASTALLAAFRRFPSSLPSEQQAKLRSEATNAYETQFLPAWRKLHDYLSGSYVRGARSGVGGESLPGRPDAYAALVQRFTTTRMAPQEIHKIGEEEVKGLEAEMQAAARETGFSGTLDEFEHKLAASPEQHFRTKDEMLTYCRSIAKIIEPEMSDLL